MSHEGFAVGEALLLSLEEGDARLGQLVLAHVNKRCVVDHVVIAPGSQQFEKVQPALRPRGCEEGEAIIADMRAKTVLGLCLALRLLKRTMLLERLCRRRSARTPKPAPRAGPPCVP